MVTPRTTSSWPTITRETSRSSASTVRRSSAIAAASAPRTSVVSCISRSASQWIAGAGARTNGSSRARRAAARRARGSVRERPAPFAAPAPALRRCGPKRSDRCQPGPRCRRSGERRVPPLSLVGTCTLWPTASSGLFCCAERVATGSLARAWRALRAERALAHWRRRRPRAPGSHRGGRTLRAGRAALLRLVRSGGGCWLGTALLLQAGLVARQLIVRCRALRRSWAPGRRDP